MKYSTVAFALHFEVCAAVVKTSIHCSTTEKNVGNLTVKTLYARPDHRQETAGILQVATAYIRHLLAHHSGEDPNEAPGGAVVVHERELSEEIKQSEV